MSQIKLDHVSAFPPSEPAQSDPGPSRVLPARYESFDDHLQQARVRAGGTSPDRRPDSDADDRPSGSPDVEPAQNTAEQTASDGAAEDQRSEANPAEADHNDGEPPDAADAQTGEQPEAESPAETGQAGAAARPGTVPGHSVSGGTVDSDPLSGNSAAGAADDQAGQLDSPSPAATNSKGTRLAPAGREVEDGQGHGPRLAESTATENDATARTAAKKDSPTQPVAKALDKAADRLSRREGANGQAAAVEVRGHPNQQNALADQTPEEEGKDAEKAVNRRQRPGPQASRVDASQRGSVKVGGEAAPAPASASEETTRQADGQTTSNRQTPFTVEHKVDAADDGSRPLGSDAAESHSSAAVRGGPDREARAGATPHAQEATLPEQADRVQFVHRVARAFQAAGGHSSNIRLRLHPPELGSLRLEISVRDGIVNARVEADTSAARNLLLDNLPALRDRLAQQDIKLEQFHVGLADRSPGGLPNYTPRDAEPEDGGGQNRPSRAKAEGNEQPGDAALGGAVSRPGEGTQLNVLI